MSKTAIASRTQTVGDVTRTWVTYREILEDESEVITEEEVTQ